MKCSLGHLKSPRLQLRVQLRVTDCGETGAPRALAAPISGHDEAALYWLVFSACDAVVAMRRFAPRGTESRRNVVGAMTRPRWRLVPGGASEAGQHHFDERMSLLERQDGEQSRHLVVTVQAARLADATDAKTEHVAAPCIEPRCRIAPRFDQQTAEFQRRCVTGCSDPERGAMVRADQFGPNCLR